MNDRDRLIELIADIQNDFEKWCVECAEDGHKDHQPLGEYLADKLLANGVIVPLCKFEDTIYRIGSKGEIYGDWELCFIQAYPDEVLYIDDSDNYFTGDDIGKTVFLTKEEAERALKEREQSG